MDKNLVNTESSKYRPNVIQEDMGERINIKKDEDVKNLIKEWIDKKKDARRYYKDEDMRDIDKEYSQKLKKLIYDKQLPDVDSVSPPLQIPTGVFGISTFGTNKKRKKGDGNYGE